MMHVYNYIPVYIFFPREYLVTPIYFFIQNFISPLSYDSTMYLIKILLSRLFRIDLNVDIHMRPVLVNDIEALPPSKRADFFLSKIISRFFYMEQHADPSPP